MSTPSVIGRIADWVLAIARSKSPTADKLANAVESAAERRRTAEKPEPETPRANVARRTRAGCRVTLPVVTRPSLADRITDGVLAFVRRKNPTINRIATTIEQAAQRRRAAEAKPETPHEVIVVDARTK